MIKDSLHDELFAVISNDAIRAASRNALKRSRSNRSMKLVRCFKGGYNAQQETPIMIALEEFTAKGLIVVETLHCERVKKDQMTERQVVDWLLGSDIHLIITHVHQNVVELLKWNMNTLMYELQKLYDHDGYPYGQYLRDPIFLQDKYEYIRLVKDICNPTLKITLREDNKYSQDDLSSISTFLHTYQDKTRSWCMKLAFVTNGFHMEQVNTYEELLRKLDFYSGNFFGIYPYVMLQPYLYNRKEYKVTLYNGKALYICKSVRRIKERAFSNSTEIMRFAETAVAMLKCETTAIDLEGVIRVDIMQGNDGSLIVNEFESLEACIWSPEGCVRNEAITLSYQATFWKNQVLKFLPLDG